MEPISYIQLRLDKYREGALQKYLDDISKLILLHDLKSKDRDHNSVDETAWFKTVAVSRMLDSERRTLLIEFLYYSDLLNPNLTKNSINVFNSDFSGINLQDGTLGRSGLRGIKARNANFKDAYLIGTTLSDSDLTNADFRGADCTGVDFSGSKLNNANFENATLLVSNFSGTNISINQLRKAKALAGSLMADGTKYDERFKFGLDRLEALDEEYDINDPEDLQKWVENSRELLTRTYS